MVTDPEIRGGAGMRLVTFEVNGTPRLGAAVGERVIDLQAAGAALVAEGRGPGAEGRGPGASAIPPDMLGLLQLGDESLDAVRALLDAVGDGATGDGRYAYHAAAVRL